MRSVALSRAGMGCSAWSGGPHFGGDERQSQGELTAAVLIGNSELRFAGATRERREFMFGECQALSFRTEGARQANPGQARGASAALGVNGPPTFCTLKA